MFDEVGLIRDAEVGQLRDFIFADYAGSGVYTGQQMESVFSDFKKTFLSNTHSAHSTSRATASRIQSVRSRILEEFGARCEDYTVVFTAGATDGCRLIAESFPWDSGSIFAYTEDNHNSVVGMRAKADKEGARMSCIKEDIIESILCGAEPVSLFEKHSDATATRDLIPFSRDHIVDNWLRISTPKAPFYRAIANLTALVTKGLSSILHKVAIASLANVMAPNLPRHLRWLTSTKRASPSVFAFPLSSNFSGAKYNIKYMSRIRETKSRDWYTMLDAASSAGKTRLNLEETPVDFVVLSFYKLFGYPSGIGCVIISNRVLPILKKTFYGGGTVEANFADLPFHKFRSAAHERYEDGTLNFQAIIALDHGFRAKERVGGVPATEARLSELVSQFVSLLGELQHFNGSSLAKVYGQHHTEHSLPPWIVRSRGHIVAFNLKDSAGNWIGHSQVAEAASEKGILLRAGCFCNPGACRLHLDLSVSSRLEQLKEGHICMDAMDIMSGLPTGAVRVSFGEYSLPSDVNAIIRFIDATFVERGPRRPISVDDLTSCTTLRVSSLSIYPVKSCGVFRLSHATVECGGMMWDRRFAIVKVSADNSRGKPLSQKDLPQMVLIQPRVDAIRNVLCLTAPGMPPVEQPLDCDGIRSVNSWLSDFLGLRVCLSYSAESYANDGSLLVLFEESVAALRGLVASTNQEAAASVHAESMRPNIVIQGGLPWSEDFISQLSIGVVQLRVTDPCTRCTMVNFDGKGGSQERGEPLLTLYKHRCCCTRQKPLFGIYAEVMSVDNGSPMQFSVGAPVRATALKAPPMFKVLATSHTA